MNRSKLYIPIGILAIIGLVFVLFPKRVFDTPLSTTLYSSDGRLLGARIAIDGQWRFESTDSLPPKFVEAIVAYEDRRFWWHLGIDPIAFARAMRDNISRRRVVSGGSTLTMQVARLALGNKSRNIFNKIVEAAFAVGLELRYSKHQILMLYGANAPFGGNVVGIEAAAWRYFGRPASSVSWAEAAMLAVLPNSPALIHPARNRAELKQKRDRLLKTLRDNGRISDTTYQLSVSEPLPQKWQDLPMLAPHLLDYVSLRGLSRATTTINSQMQQSVSDVLLQRSTTFSGNHVNNIAAVVAELKSGKVIAYVGNTPKSERDVPAINVDIIQSARSSGSILKPFLYGAMLQEGDITPTMLVADIPFRRKNFTPTNYYKNFDGAVAANNVIARSLNIPSVVMLQEYGVEKFQMSLKKLGFSTFEKPADHYGLSLILGGGEVTLWEAVQAYAYLGQLLVSDSVVAPLRGLTFFENEPGRVPSSLPMSPGAAWLTIEAMKEVGRPDNQSGWRHFASSRHVAWKTGTSYGNRDGWAIGLTPEYVVGVWVGNAGGEGRTGLTGTDYAAPVMFDLFNLLPNNTRWFERPDIDLVQAEVCQASGHIASTFCPVVDTVFTTRRSVNTPSCPYHKMVTISKDGQYRVNSNCATLSDMVQECFFVLPPAWEWYYRIQHPEYKTVPPFHPKYGLSSVDGVIIDIIYPTKGSIVIPTRSLSGKEQGIVMQAVHRNVDAVLYWHVSGNYIGQTSVNHKIIWPHPTVGHHMLKVVDSDGLSLEIDFEVE